MISRATIYKQLGNWVHESHPLYSNLIFFPEGAAATNTHQAIFLKSSFVDKAQIPYHLETPSGLPVPFDQSMISEQDRAAGYTNLKDWMKNSVKPSFDRIYPTPDKRLWTGTFTADCLQGWKSALEVIKRLSRIRTRYGTETTMILAKEGVNLVAYASKSPYCSAKFYLSQSLSPESDWSMACTASFLCNIIEFLMDAQLPSFNLSITDEEYPMLLVEWDEFWAVSTATSVIPEGLDHFYELAHWGG